MPPIVLARNILTIDVPKRKVFVVSRIYLLPHSFRKQKICFNQCRFLFQKLRIWKSKLTCGKKSQFPKEEVFPKILKPNFPKRRRSWTSSYRSISILKDKTLSCNWGELWEFTASAVGGKSFEKNDSAILAPAKSLRFLNSEQVSFGGRSYAMHELWEIITQNYDLIEKWNNEIRAFLTQERKLESEIVKL